MNGSHRSSLRSSAMVHERESYRSESLAGVEAMLLAEWMWFW